MAVLKVIFRIDFGRANFDILDRPGSVMRILTDMGGEDYWPEFQEAAQQHLVTAAKTEGAKHRQITVEPTSMTFTMEDVRGIDPRRLEDNAVYANLFKAVNRVCEEFKIRDLARAGIRFTYLSSLSTKNESLKPAFKVILGTGLSGAIENTLGELQDYGIKIDGSSKDKTKYHLNFGPYEDHEFDRHFKPSKSEVTEKYNLIIDLDLYEEKLALSVRPSVWARSSILKLEEAVKSIESSILEGWNKK